MTGDTMSDDKYNYHVESWRRRLAEEDEHWYGEQERREYDSDGARNTNAGVDRQEESR